MFVDAGILQHFFKHFADFLPEYRNAVFRGKGMPLHQFVGPVCMLAGGIISIQIFA